MKSKKIISLFLILVFVLQLLPVKQAVKYFFEDNVMTEEIAHTSKSAAKSVSNIIEDHFLHEHDYLSHPYILFDYTISSLYKDMLPSSHADDIETPPPNAA